MSHYPPGVTGNEPQIAGVPEGRRHVACPNRCPARNLTVEPRGTDRMTRVRDSSPGDWYWRLSELDVEEVACPFAADLDGWFDGQGDEAEFVAFDPCPLCEGEIRVGIDDTKPVTTRRTR